VSVPDPAAADVTPPEVPTGLTADVSSGSYVDLDWDDNGESDLLGYNVWRAPQGTTAWEQLNLVGALGASAFRDLYATPGTSYDYSVSALDTTGNESAKCDPVSAVLPSAYGVRLDPATFHITASDADLVEWGGPSRFGFSISSGSVTVDVSDAAMVPRGGTAIPVSKGNFIVTGQSVGFTVGFSPPPDLPPATPRGLTATADVDGITLDWFDNTESDLAGYRVYSSISSSGPFARIATPGSSIYDDGDAAEGVDTFYRVTAVDNAGHESGFASVSAVRPIPPQGAPVKLSSAGTMSPCTVHCYATPHGGKRYTNPAIGVRAGIVIPVGDFLTSQFVWEFLENDGTTPNGEFPRLPGFNAAHQFVNTTTSIKHFKVRLTVTYQNGSKAVYVSDIAVLPDTRTKVYVDAQAGNDVNDGRSTSKPKKTLAAALSSFGGNDTELLLAKVSNTSPTPPSYFYNLGGTKICTGNNIVIDSYTPAGRTNTDMPTIVWTKAIGPNDFGPLFSFSGKHITMQNVRCQTPVAIEAGGTRPKIVYLNAAVDVTLRKIESVSTRDLIEQSVSGDPNAITKDAPDGVLISGCTAPDLGWGFMFAFIVGSNYTMLGNTAIDPEVHCIRVAGVDNLLLYQNSLQWKAGGRASGLRCGINDHVGRYHWIAQNSLYRQGKLALEPLASDDGSAGYATRTDRLQWVVAERNNFDVATGDGGVRLGHGTEHVILRNNIFTGINTTQLNMLGYNARYERGVDDVRIYNNTFYQTGTSSSGIKTSSTATSVTVRNNAMYAPLLVDTASTAVMKCDGGMGCFSSGSISRNVWPPTIQKGSPGVPWTFIFKVNGAEKDLAAWNAQSQVGDDIGYTIQFASQAGPNTAFKPAVGTTTALNGRPVAGVFEDYYGTPRSQSAGSWAAGAVEA